MIKQTNAVIPECNRGNANLTTDIMEFLKSGCENCEVDISGYKDARGCRASYAYSASRSGLSKKVSVVIRGNRVFLIRKV